MLSVSSVAKLNILRFPTYAIRLTDATIILISMVIDLLRAIFNIICPPLAETCRILHRKILRNTLVKCDRLYFVVQNYRSLRIIDVQFAEPEGYSVLKTNLKRGSILIDVGAHIGAYTLRAAKQVGPDGLVVAIEPHPENFKLLKLNVNLNGFNNVMMLNVAAWNKIQKLKLYSGAESGWQTVKKQRGKSFVHTSAMPVDDIVKRLRLQRVDMIKVDVEGSEVEVMEGMKETLARFRPLVIIEVFQENHTKIMELAKIQQTYMQKLSQIMYLLIPYMIR